MVKATARTERALLKDRVYKEIKDRIMSEEYPPLSFLSERNLSAAFKVSKTPVRNALERLENEGFVVISPQQGVVVQDLTVSEIADLFDTRAVLESHVVRSLAGRLNPKQRTLLEKHLDEEDAAARDSDLAESVLLDARFHILLAECLGNSEIIRILRTSRDRMHRIIARVVARKTDRPLTSSAEHREIAKAIQQNNPEEASRKMISHLEYGKQMLLS